MDVGLVGVGQRVWAKRVPQERVRALYRSESQGRLDDELVLEVGWALWARARDVAGVSQAASTGVVECPECGGAARRRRREREGPRTVGRQVRCEHCGHETMWHAVKDHLRAHPRCLTCWTPLEWEYGARKVTCPGCGAAWPFRNWRQRLRGRKRLPCPHCCEILRQPELVRLAEDGLDPPEPEVGPEAVDCPDCGTSHLWSDVRERWRQEPKCTCGAPLVDADRLLRCAECGKSWTRSRFARRLSRRRTAPCQSCGGTIRRERDLVHCPDCGWEGTWSRFRRAWHGQDLLTGYSVPACREFVERWPTCQDTRKQMILIDCFLHELHNGPLAPLFVSGGRQSVLALLDELAGVAAQTGAR